MNERESLLRERIDPALTPPLLSKVASRALGEQVTVNAWCPLSGGCWNRVIGLQGDHRAEQLVLKISPAPADAGLEREYHVLQWFKAHTRLPVPEPLLVDATGREIPGSFIVMSRMPGRPLHDVFHLLDSGHRRRLTMRIAEDVAELHQSTTGGFGGVELAEAGRKDWPSFWLPRLDAVREEAARSGEIDQRILSRIARIRPSLSPVLDVGHTSTLTHYDIWSGNVMVSFEGGAPRIEGYLDVPGYWADPVRELSFAEMFGIADRLFYEVYTSAHRLPDGWQLRRDLYNLKMHLKHITMYPDDRFYRDGAERCLASLEAHA